MNNLKEIILNCTKCQLSQTRHHVIFGEGNPNADILIIGEGSRLRRGYARPTIHRKIGTITGQNSCSMWFYQRGTRFH